MDCPQYQDHITRLIDRPLSPETETHIKSCPVCAKAWENERRVDMVAHDAFAPLKLDRDLTDKILRRLPEAEELDDLPTPGARLLWWSAGLSAAAAMLIVGFFAIQPGDEHSDLQGNGGSTPAKDGKGEVSQAEKELTFDNATVITRGRGDFPNRPTTSGTVTSYEAWKEIEKNLGFGLGFPADFFSQKMVVYCYGTARGSNPIPPTIAKISESSKKVTVYFYPAEDGWTLTDKSTSDIYRFITIPQSRKPVEFTEVKKPELSTPVTGAAELRYRLKTKEGDNVREMAERTREVFLRRADLMGLPAPEILVEKNGTIIVWIPDTTSLATCKNILRRVGSLQLTEVGDAELHKAQSYPSTPKGWIWIDNTETDAGGEYPHLRAKKILVSEKPVIDGTYIETARSDRGGSGDHVVIFTLKPAGARIFEEATERLAGKGHIAIIFDGKLQSRPFVRSKISRHGRIDGYDSEESAKMMATVLRSGALPAPVELISERITGVPDLSTPEKAWEAFVEALKSGDEERIKAVTTEKGRESIKGWGGKVTDYPGEQKWRIEGDEARATAWREPAVPGGFVTIELKKTPEGWKLDGISPGE